MKKSRKIAAWLLTPALMLWLLEGLARNDLGAFFAWIAARPLLALMNYALLLGLCLMTTLCRSRRVRGCLLLTLAFFCALLGVVNHYKLVYRLEPVLWSDVSQLGDGLAAVTGLELDIDIGQVLWLGAGFAVAAGLCGTRLKGRMGGRHPALALMGVALAAGMPFLCTFELAGGAERTDMADHARAEGCLYTAFAAENHRRALMRMDYDPAEVEALWKRLEDEAPAAEEEGQRPNIIFVLSESFTDEAILGKGAAFTDTLMPFYRSFVRECQRGLLYVPKIGGGTSETEFEVLTGMQSKYTVNPYSIGLPPVKSVADVLKDKGYTATVIHWYAGVYYNRYHNLPMEGFDAIYTTDTTDREFGKTGMFVSDEEHYSAIMERMARTDSRDFVFCLTMQNHGGYGYDDFRITYGADQPFANSLSAESEKILSNYCYLLRRTDAALSSWIQRLRAFDEPVLLVFFGDHLAPLGVQTYEELGLSLSGEQAHQTPYFIWSNTAPMSGEMDMKAYQLGGYALTLAGLNDDPFFTYVEKLRRSGVGTDAAYDLLSYDVLFGQQYGYRLLGLSPANPGCQIGGPMTLEGFDAAVIDDAVYLRARLDEPDQKYRLRVNGQTQDTRYVLQTGEPLTLQCVLDNYYGTRYNESRILSYADTDALLRQCGRLNYQALPLWECGYELVRNKWYQNYAVFKSKTPFEADGDAAATLDGARLDGQPYYGISKANQYALDEDGYVYIAIAKNALARMTGGDARAYLKERRGTLYAFED